MRSSAGRGVATPRRILFALLVSGAGVSAFLALRAQAVPRYSARYEQTCALCHVNPTGGGMRAPYASRELVPKEIAWAAADSGFLAGIEPEIARNVTIGTDFRQLYVAADPASDQPVQRGFFQMQGDVYLTFQLDKKTLLYFDRGISTSYELFGMTYFQPWAYLKAGRFVPSYGWKFDDHTHFVRSELGFFPPANSDVGLELGVTPKRFDVQLALLNGNRGSIQDSDRELAVALNGLYRFRAGPVGAAAGLAGSHQPGRLEDVSTAGLRGSLTWQGFAWVGQGDWIRREPPGSRDFTGVVTSHELTCLIRQGLELKAGYDFFDPDLDRRSGTRARWGGGVFVMPRSFLALEALYRRYEVEPGPALPGRDYGEAVVQLHLLY